MKQIVIVISILLIVFGSAIAQPEIHFDSFYYHFPPISPDTAFTMWFKFQNIGDSTLKIKEVVSETHNAYLEHYSIAPGQHDSIRIIFKAYPFQIGNWKHNFYVTSNARSHPNQYIHFGGIVVPSDTSKWSNDFPFGTTMQHYPKIKPRAEKISDSIFIFTTYSAETEPRDSSRCVALIGEQSVILLNAGYNPEQLRLIRTWCINHLGMPIDHCIITNANKKNYGGLVLKKPIDGNLLFPIHIFFSGKTATLIQQHDSISKQQHQLAYKELLILHNERIECFSPDRGSNVIVFDRKKNMLFIGDLLNDINTSNIDVSLRNDLITTLTYIQKKYPHPKFIISSDGLLKDNNMIDQILQQLKTSSNSR